ALAQSPKKILKFVPISSRSGRTSRLDPTAPPCGHRRWGRPRPTNRVATGDVAMRASLIALVSTAFLAAAPAIAADTPKDVKGLFRLTDYPAMSVQPGSTSTVALRLQNYGLTPERYTLSVADVPAGWTATLLGGGQPVAAAMPATDQSVSLQLRIEVPQTAGSGTKTLTVKAEGQGGTSVTLPV